MQLNYVIIYIIRFAMTQLYFAVHMARWAELIFHCFWECNVLLLRCKLTCHHFWEFSFSDLVLFLGVNIHWHYLTYITSRVCLAKKMQIPSFKTSIWNKNCNLAKKTPKFKAVRLADFLFCHRSWLLFSLRNIWYWNLLQQKAKF